MQIIDHGEVFTSEREVNALLDLVKNECERIDSRFLEPACGDGNFLIEILRRKLNVVKNRYKKSQSEYERYAVVAVSSCYGVDILEDNCIECRNRLVKFFESEYKLLYKKNARDKIIEVVRFVLSKNIVCGDAQMVIEGDSYIVLKDSKIRIDTTSSCREHIKDKRQILISNQKLVEAGKYLVATDDLTFDSPSTAASLVGGVSLNGRICWQNNAGKTLKDLQLGEEK